tara:strand:+ start:1497 stop:2177 length:681 start_codon:yes stop_codon:yes gene_type:complete
MSQHDYDIANQLSANLRIDLNNALQSLNSNNSGATEPATTFANMLWYDTASNILKMKPEDNAAGQWINIGYLDQGTDTFKILDDTIVATTAGVTAGLIGDQPTATWQAGTGTLDSLVSPANVKAAILALTPTPPVNGVGVGQTWQNVSGSRSSGVWYQNTSGKPIQLFVKQINGGDAIRVGVSTSSYVTMNNNDYDSDLDNGAFWIIPTNNYYYLLSVKGDWFELR